MGGVGRAHTRLPSPWGALRIQGEAARAPAWCEGGDGLPQCHGGLKHETLLQRVQVRVGPGRETTHGKFRYKRTFFSPPLLQCWCFRQRSQPMTFAMFTGSVVFKVSKWIAVFLPVTKKGLCVCLMYVCVVSVCGRRGGWGVGGCYVSAFVDVTWFPNLHHTAKCVCLGEGNKKSVSC